MCAGLNGWRLIAKCYSREKCLISDLLFISTIKGIARLTFIAVIYDYSAKIVSRFTLRMEVAPRTTPPTACLITKKEPLPNIGNNNFASCSLDGKCFYTIYG